MSIPLEITFKGLDSSPAVETLIRDQIGKLERYGQDVERCHVVVERPGRRARGNPFHVTIYLTVPGVDLVVSRHPQVDSMLRQKGSEERIKSTEVGMQAKDVRVAVNEAFKRARRLLKIHERRKRGQVKSHEEQPRGRVARLSEDGEYGLIQTPDGREVYFHRKSLINATFSELATGVAVAFAEEAAEKGSRASSVRVLGSID